MWNGCGFWEHKKFTPNFCSFYKSTKRVEVSQISKFISSFFTKKLKVKKLKKGALFLIEIFVPIFWPKVGEGLWSDRSLPKNQTPFLVDFLSKIPWKIERNSSCENLLCIQIEIDVDFFETVTFQLDTHLMEICFKYLSWIFLLIKPV